MGWSGRAPAHTETSSYLRNLAVPRGFLATFICDAFETDWPVGAAGFEPLHLEIRSAELHPDLNGMEASIGRLRFVRSAARDAQISSPGPRAESLGKYRF